MTYRYHRLLLVVFLSLFAHAAMTGESLELDGATIVGSRELPKALHIVPWKATAPVQMPWVGSAIDSQGQPISQLQYST